LTRVRQRVAQGKIEMPLSGLRALISIQRRPLDLSSVLRRARGLSLIVDIKRQSHRGKPLIQVPYNPVELAHLYEELGVQALSVATDPYYFQGDLYDLAVVAETVQIPVLRNDFVHDGYQVYEARAAGADGVILIAALLGEHRLWGLVSITQRLRMTAVVQVQNEEELARALKADPLVIAISNVDWRTFEVDLTRTPRLRPQIPDHIVVVSMGGLRTPEDVALIKEAGVDAVSLGEAILGVPDPVQALSELFSLVDDDPTESRLMNR
jgi:indole-3-glycerol phosphate synthase